MVWSLQALPQLSDEQFTLWSQLLEERAGIYLSEQQKTFLQTQVIQRMRELGIDDYGKYYEIVVDCLSGLVEWTKLVDRLVVNETRFFRHRASIDFIGQKLIERMSAAPETMSDDTAGEELTVDRQFNEAEESDFGKEELVGGLYEALEDNPPSATGNEAGASAAREEAISDEGFIKELSTDIEAALETEPGTAFNAKFKDAFDIWSVGCSSGEEPYSLAMVINDAYHMVGREARFSITATDISRAALTLARAGIYSERKLETIDRTFRQRYFSKVAEGRYQIAGHLRDRICFNHGNILNINEMPTLKVDVIYCQNLLVYFRRWLREHILNAFVERLHPGGLLVIGVGEIVGWSHPAMRRVPAEAVQAYVHI